MAPLTAALQQAPRICRLASIVIFMVAAATALADDPKPILDKTKRPCLAVLDFYVSGKVDAAGSRAAAALVRKEVNAGSKYDLIDRQMMVERMGEKDFAATTECDQLKCLVQYGKSLAADKIVGGSMVSFSDSWVIEVRLVDVNTGREEKTFAKRHKGTMDDLLDLVVEGAAELLGENAATPPSSQLPSSERNPKKPDKMLDLGSGVKLAMMLIPAGEFAMGSPETEPDRLDIEGPRHRVRITKQFYMGQCEVTQAQWYAIMGNNPSHFSGADLPVEMVSWEDCQQFCRKLSAKTGLRVRLPTEAEWEYACRAGSKDRFCFGAGGDMDSGLDAFAWYRFNSDMQTHAVGGKRANAWGLCDMHGNVWEWCEDVYLGDYTDTPTDGSAWTGNGPGRVIRGGSFGYYSPGCRCARRNGHKIDIRGDSLGFRLVVEVPGS
ncbi:MAG: formylglycine-generating enzyme family protein [Planctomycetes bacterium]|nr:formylglycine-generating enzyme family protein [Planctomycetota bacterium]